MVIDAEQVLNICRLAKVKKIGMSTNTVRRPMVLPSSPPQAKPAIWSFLIVLLLLKPLSLLFRINSTDVPPNRLEFNDFWVAGSSRLCGGSMTDEQR